jgi:hypothetical protein
MPRPLAAAVLIAGLCTGAIACGHSSPVSPSGGGTNTPTPPSTVLRGSIRGEATAIGSGLRLVTDDGASISIDLAGQFNASLATRPRSLRLVGPGLDVPVSISVSGEAVILELSLELRGSIVVTLSACSISSTTSNGLTAEVRFCVTTT